MELHESWSPKFWLSASGKVQEEADPAANVALFCGARRMDQFANLMNICFEEKITSAFLVSAAEEA